MAGINSDFDIADIIKHLKLRQSGGHHTVLVLGARTGGLFNSEYFYETLKQFSKRDFKGLSKVEKFAECYRTLTEQGLFSADEIDHILKDALKEVEMSDTDMYLANLINLGLFDVIVTTNVDILLEKALEHIGLKEMYDFIVHDPKNGGNKEKRSQLMPNMLCRIIKAFGQITNDDYSIERTGYWSKKEHLAKILEEILSRDVMAIGLDPVWDAEFYRIFPAHGGQSLWFISEDTPDISNSVIASISKDRNVHYLSRSEEGNYSYCIYALHRQFIGALPATLVGTGLILGELRRMREEIQKLREELRGDRL